MIQSTKSILIYSIIVVAGIMVTLGVIATKNYLTGKFQEKLVAELEFALTSTHEAFLEWTNVQLRGLQQWPSNADFRQNVEILLEISPNQSDLASHPIQQTVRNQLRGWLNDFGHQGYFVISLEGINLSSSRDSNLGEVNIVKRMQLNFFEKIANGFSMVSHPLPSDVYLEGTGGELSEGVATMFAMMPIQDEQGAVIAIFAARIDPSGTYSSIFQSGRVGYSGETYSFNKEGRMLSESRFNQQLTEIGLLMQGQTSSIIVDVRDPGTDLTEGNISSTPREEQPLTLMARSATNGNSGTNIEGYNDYRGMVVVGSWLWDSDHNLGVTTEIDKQEVFNNFRESLLIIYVFGAVCGAILLATLFTIIWVNRRLDENEKALIDSEKSFRLMLENSPIAVVISLNDGTIDDGLVLFANPKLFELTGFSKENIGNLRTSDFVDSKNVKKNRELDPDSDGTLWNKEQLIHHSDGSELYTLMSLSPLEYQGQQAALIWFYDVNDLKETEEELRIARNEAQAAGEAKSRFMANMSHEIRTPLNAVLGFTDLILRDSKLAKDHQKNLEIVNRSGIHLLSLINDILDMSKIEAGRLQLEMGNFNPELMFKDMEVLFQIQMAEKGLDFSAVLDDEVPVTLNSDMRRIKQILINLTGNALKFTKQGSININGRTMLDKDKGLIFEIDISDTGSGIALEDQVRIFSDFEQAGEGIREGKGTGLGLPLSRRLARELGGDITITSELNEGTTFHVTLQVEETSDISADLLITNHEIIGLKDAQQPFLILIVDDIEENRLYLKAMLESVGFITRTCSDGRQAIKHTEQWLPDLILMDAFMPEMNGSKAIANIRDNDDIKDTPIIVISASSLEEDIKVVLEAGADIFLAKPVARNQLLKTIGQLTSIEFEYQQEIAVPEITQVTNGDKDRITEAAHTLPAKLIGKLQKAANTLNATELEFLLEEVKSHDQQLGDHLNILIDDYEWQEINSILGL